MEIVVHDAQLADYGPQMGDMFVLAVEVIDDDGTSKMVAQHIPADTFEWRAVEYGIDPTDMDTLIEIVIHEPYINMTADDPLMIHNTDDQQAARNHHLNKIRARFTKKPKGLRGKPKLRGVVDRTRILEEADDEVDPLDFVKSKAFMRPEFIEAKKVVFDMERRGLRDRIDPRPEERALRQEQDLKRLRNRADTSKTERRHRLAADEAIVPVMLNSKKKERP